MTAQKLNDWQFDQRNCTCLIHRYHVAHICICGKIISHSQADFNQHKNHGGLLNFDPVWYKHGDTVTTLWDRLHGYGLLDYFNPDYTEIYMALCEKELI